MLRIFVFNKYWSIFISKISKVLSSNIIISLLYYKKKIIKNNFIQTIFLSF